MTEQNGLERSSATDELRRLLDERGIEWHGFEPNPWVKSTSWDIDASDPRYGVEAGFEEFDDGVTLLRFWNATPEQAIAATLGADAKPTQAESSGTCEMEYVSDFMSWHCKACDQMDMAPRNPKPRYCKWCGRKVVDE